MPLRSLIALSLLLLASAPAQESSTGFRNWTSTEGQTLEARLVTFEVGAVVLAGRRGNTIRMPTSRLSSADQDYLKIWLPHKGTSWSQVDSFNFDGKKLRGYDFSIVPMNDKVVKFDEDFDLYGSPTIILRKTNESLADGETDDWLLVSYVEKSKALNKRSDELGMINTRKEQALIIPSPFTKDVQMRKSRTRFRVFVYVADYKSGEPRSNILAIDAMIVRKPKGLRR